MSGWSFGVVALMCAAVWDAGFSQERPDEPNKMAQAGQAGESCFSGVQTGRNVAGKPIVLTTKQLDERATLRVMPNYPVLLQQARIIVQGRIKILIGSGGEVTCAVALSGHPLVARSVVEAVKGWRFPPYESSGKRTPVLGYFDFCVPSSRCPLMDFDYTPSR